MRESKWERREEQVKGATGCLTALLVGLAIDAALLAVIVWCVRTIIG